MGPLTHRLDGVCSSSYLDSLLEVLWLWEKSTLPLA